jgi:hypothetical protein
MILMTKINKLEEKSNIDYNKVFIDVPLMVYDFSNFLMDLAVAGIEDSSIRNPVDLMQSAAYTYHKFYDFIRSEELYKLKRVSYSEYLRNEFEYDFLNNWNFMNLGYDSVEEAYLLKVEELEQELDQEKVYDLQKELGGEYVDAGFVVIRTADHSPNADKNIQGEVLLDLKIVRDDPTSSKFSSGNYFTKYFELDLRGIEVKDALSLIKEKVKNINDKIVDDFTKFLKQGKRIWNNFDLYDIDILMEEYVEDKEEWFFINTLVKLDRLKEM